ncbi:hypothetical protein FIBSPDRAFT_1039514 [Athelia psychrophila]|uniref:NYN domain-containing protein n=1 Tax=Athelia psychrophila TaxID=1759441 RepID=A0A166RKH3_9AGAM|nr:hypothetical protein FIBSPDRAFT_1039514 [Fibularhizoctonia sp. CBS 109695]
MASVAVFWDVDMFTPSFGGSAQIVETLACQYGSTDSIHAYAEDTQMPPTLVARPSISVMDCSQGTSKGNMIAVDMFAYAMRTPYPATMIVISDAQMLAYAVSILRLRKYRVVVVGSAEGSRGSLKQRASEFKEWDVLIGQRRNGAHLDTPEGGKATQVDVCDDEDLRDGVLGHAPSIDNEQPREALADARVLDPFPLEAKKHPVLIKEASLQERLLHSPLSLSHYQNPLSASPASASSALLSDLIPARYPVPVAESFQPTSPSPMSEAFSTGTTQIPDSNVPPSFGNETNPQSSKRAAVIAQAKAMSPSERMLTVAQLMSQGVISSAPADDTCRPTSSVPSLDIPDLAQDTTQLPSVGLSVSEQSDSETLSDVTFTPLVTADPIKSSLHRSPGDATATFSHHLPDGDRLGVPEDGVESSPRPMTGILPCTSLINGADLSPIFRALVDILRPHGRLARTEVAGILRIYIRQDKPAFSRRGIKKPSDLFALAASEGVVVLSETIVHGKPAQWIALAPAWRTLAECTSIPEVEVSVSLEKEVNALDEKRDDNSHAAVIDHAAENAGKSVQEPIVTKPQCVSSINVQSNGSAKQQKQQKRGSITVDTIYPTPPPSTSIVDQELLAKLISLVEQHGPEADRSVVGAALKASNPFIYAKAGVHSLKTLASLAVDRGLVTLGHSTTRKGKTTYTISLAADWQRHRPATSTPPANDAGLSQWPDQSNRDSCGTAVAMLDRASDNAGVHDLAIANTQRVPAARPQANGPVKQGKVGPVTADVVSSIPPPRTSVVDKALFAGLIGLIKKHGPEAERTVIGFGMKASNPSIYAKAGVDSFKRFVNLAVDQGLVTLGHGRSRRGKKIDTISLAPQAGWQSHHPATDALSSATWGGEEASSGSWQPAFGSFQTLVEEIQRHPVTRPTRSLVYAKLAQDPARHLFDNPEDFDGHIAQAYDAGIIDLGENYHADGTRTEWISLGPTCQHLQDSEKDSYYWPQADALVQQSGSETTSALPVIKPTARIKGVRLGIVPAGFTPLISVLRKFKSLGNSSPCCTAVSQELLQANPSIFHEAGCQDVMEYAHLAGHAGVATVSQSAGGHRISLL